MSHLLFFSFLFPPLPPVAGASPYFVPDGHVSARCCEAEVTNVRPPRRSLAYLEMRNILARLLWNFDLELMPESKDWADQKVFLTWQKKPLMIKVHPVKRDQ